MHLKEKFTKQISKTEMKVLLLPEYFAYLHWRLNSQAIISSQKKLKCSMESWAVRV
jgi:hypothetical protein